MRGLPVAAVVILVATSVADAHPVPGDPGGVQTVVDEGTRTIEPAQSYQSTSAQLAEGDQMHFEWKVLSPAGASLRFSIRADADPSPLSETVDEADNRSFAAGFPGEYSVRWDNEGAEAVAFAYAVHAVPNREIPADGLLLIPTVGLAALVVGWLSKKARS